MLNACQIQTSLASVNEDDELFVSYIAFRKPSENAIKEAQIAEGMSRRHFVGKFVGTFLNKQNELCFTMFCFNRTNSRDASAEGNYRTFNCIKGSVVSIQLIDHSQKPTD